MCGFVSNAILSISDENRSCNGTNDAIKQIYEK